jgi:hypothetical protein
VAPRACIAAALQPRYRCWTSSIVTSPTACARRPAWTRQRGHVSVDTSAWTRQRGHVSVDTSAWTRHPRPGAQRTGPAASPCGAEQPPPPPYCCPYPCPYCTLPLLTTAKPRRHSQSGAAARGQMRRSTPSLPYRVDTSRPSPGTDWTRLVPPPVLTRHVWARAGRRAPRGTQAPPRRPWSHFRAARAQLRAPESPQAPRAARPAADPRAPRQLCAQN